jgi:hypothetical protein
MYSQTYYPDQRYYSFIDHMLVFHFLHPGCCWNTNYHQYGNLFSNSCDQNMVFLASHLCGKGLPILITRKGGKRVTISVQCTFLVHPFCLFWSVPTFPNGLFPPYMYSHVSCPLDQPGPWPPIIFRLFTPSVCSGLFLPFLTVSLNLTCTAMPRVR